MGVDKIAPVLRGLAGQIVEGCGSGSGYEGAAGEPNAGIVSFRKAGIDSVGIYSARLRQQSMITAPRAGWVRASPHFYITAEDIEKMLGLLPVTEKFSRK